MGGLSRQLEGPSSLSICENNLRRFCTITKSKHFKVLRLDTFYQRALKILAEEGSELFLLLFHGSWKSETVPDNWGEKLIVIPVFKGTNGIAQANTGSLTWHQSQAKLYNDT